jgi:hypothetical protein
MRPYRASNHAPFASVILLILVALIAGVIAGGVLFAVEYFIGFYLILAFPIIAGLVAGNALSLVVRGGKVRSPILGVICGLVAGVTIYGVYHFASYYITFRGEVRTVLTEGGQAPANDAKLDETINEFLRQDVGDTGFVGFMRLAAEEGFSITRTTAPAPVSGAAPSGILIQGTVAWVYWAVEILLAGIVAAAAAARATREPFDESSQQWYDKPEPLAAASNKARRDLLSALNASHFSEAGSLITRRDIKFPRLELFTRRSPDAASRDIMLIMNYATNKNRANEIKRGIISAGDLELLTRAMSSADQQAANGTPPIRRL